MQRPARFLTSAALAAKILILLLENRRPPSRATCREYLSPRCLQRKVRNEWNGVEVEDLVRAQLALFADLIGSRIGVDGPKLRFKAASAQAIGLALHELATNAGKYGALSTDKGRVYVSWGTVDHTFTMSWIEREGPPVSAPKRRGFGTIVMEAMAERSVDGAVDLDYEPSGLTWRLTCPAASALESGWGS
jgi:two-component sensor histidine kinase